MDSVNIHLWKLSSSDNQSQNFVVLALNPLSRSISVQRLCSSVYDHFSHDPDQVYLSLFVFCRRSTTTHTRILYAEETSSSFIAFMHLCPLDLCSKQKSSQNQSISGYGGTSLRKHCNCSITLEKAVNIVNRNHEYICGAPKPTALKIIMGFELAHIKLNRD